MELLLSERAVTVYEILIILLLIFILFRQKKKNKEIQERRRVGNIKKRNEQLEEILKNPDGSAEWSKHPNPYEVQYMHTDKSAMDVIPGLQVEIEVHTDTSIQRYLFDLSQEITIGREENNVLPIKDKMAAKKNCSIFVKDQSVFVKNLCSTHPVCIQRGKNRQLIQNQIVKLKSKDILTLGKTTLHILLYEN